MTTLAEFLGGAGTQAAKGLMTGTVIDDVWKYVIDRVAGTPGASVAVTEESPSVVYFRWASEEEPTRS